MEAPDKSLYLHKVLYTPLYADDQSSGKLSGAPDKLSGASDKLSGASDKSTGASDKLTGASDKLTGASDKLSGASDKLTGASDKLTGASDKLTGASDKSSGAADRLSSASTVGGTHVRSLKISVGYHIMLTIKPVARRILAILRGPLIFLPLQFAHTPAICEDKIRHYPAHSEIIVNYLFHLFLSGDDPEILTGNFMGDFVKGPLGHDYPPGLRIGLELHRRIDSFARDQVHFNRSRLRLDPEFGLYRGILVDLYYDHFLALTWDQWSGETLANYLPRVGRMVEAKGPLLPERLQGLVPIIFEEWLPSYREPAAIGRALERMARRVKRANPLAGGGAELARHYQGLQEDFLGFLPEAREFVKTLTGPTKEPSQ